MAAMTFGQWVKEQRLAKGWGPTQCARRAGWNHHGQWVRIESDAPMRKDGTHAQPRRESCEKIALGLGLPAAEVLRRAGYSAGESGVSYFQEDDQTMSQPSNASLVKENRPSMADAVEQMLDEIATLRAEINRDQHDTEMSRERTLAKLAKIGAS
jgi:hypothetical protein